MWYEQSQSGLATRLKNDLTSSRGSRWCLAKCPGTFLAYLSDVIELFVVETLKGLVKKKEAGINKRKREKAGYS